LSIKFYALDDFSDSKVTNDDLVRDFEDDDLEKFVVREPE